MSQIRTTIIFLAILLGMASLTKAQSASDAENILIIKLLAYEKNERIYIDWQTNGDINRNYWEVQGSANGKDFSTIALVLGPDPSKTGEEFQYKDKISIRNKFTSYRVVHFSKTGKKFMSETIKPIKMESMSFINPDIKNKMPILY